MILQTHSYWAYAAVLILLFAVVIFKLGWFQSKPFTTKERRLALFTLIVYHIQLLIGLAWYFMSPAYQFMKQFGMGSTMKESTMRQQAVEHPIIMLLAVTLITIGYSKHKKRTTDKSKFSTLIWYYGIALLLVLIMIPWNRWFD
jgi:hypothetical protein